MAFSMYLAVVLPSRLPEEPRSDWQVRAQTASLIAGNVSGGFDCKVSESKHTASKSMDRELRRTKCR